MASGGTVLKLIQQAKIHADFGEVGEFSQHGPVFALGGGIVTSLLCLLWGREVSADRLAESDVRCCALRS